MNKKLWSLDEAVEIKPVGEDEFLTIRETLTRMRNPIMEK